MKRKVAAAACHKVHRVRPRSSNYFTNNRASRARARNNDRRGPLAFRDRPRAAIRHARKNLSVPPPPPPHPPPCDKRRDQKRRTERRNVGYLTNTSVIHARDFSVPQNPASPSNTFHATRAPRRTKNPTYSRCVETSRGPRFEFTPHSSPANPRSCIIAGV